MQSTTQVWNRSVADLTILLPKLSAPADTEMDEMYELAQKQGLVPSAEEQESND